MLKFIQFVQKRPSDVTIRVTGIVFGLIILLAGYYNLIYQGDAIESTIFGKEVSQQMELYIKYAILGLGIFPLTKNIINKCVLQKKYIKYLQLFYAIALFYASSVIADSAQLDFDTLLVFMGLLPLFAGITGKFITTKCLKHGEKITKIRV